MVLLHFEVLPIAQLFKQYVFGDKQYRKVNNSISNEYNIYNNLFFWTDSDINTEKFIT